MIALLTGRLDSIGEDRAVVDVGGVGYLVFCSAPTLDRLAPVGETVRLEIETHVREDHIHLYGFADVAEREWFRLLTTVQGVGARVALAILSVLTANDLLQAIAGQCSGLPREWSWCKVSGAYRLRIEGQSGRVASPGRRGVDRACRRHVDFRSGK